MARLSARHHLRRALPAVIVGLFLAPITIWHASIVAAEISGGVTDEVSYSSPIVLAWSITALILCVGAFGFLGWTIFRAARKMPKRRPLGLWVGSAAIVFGMVALLGVYLQIAN